MMKCLLIGNFGVGNVGDEALKEYFLDTFPEVDWVVVGEDVPRLPGGLRSFLSMRWIKTVRALKHCDVVVFGGGSLFTDAESVYACFLWYIHARAARFFGKPIHFAFQGVGPFRTGVGERLARKSFGWAQTISVRDEESAKRIELWKSSTKVIRSFDPVIRLLEDKKSEIRSEKACLPDRQVLILIPRKNSGGKFTKAAQEAVESRDWNDVRVISMQSCLASESNYCQKLAKSLSSSCHIIDAQELDEIVDNISDASLVVTERYHGALVSLALHIETRIVSQKDGDKLSSLEGIDISQAKLNVTLGENLLLHYL